MNKLPLYESLIAANSTDSKIGLPITRFIPKYRINRGVFHADLAVRQASVAELKRLRASKAI